MKVAITEIEHNYTGFAKLIDLVNKTNVCFGEAIEIDMKDTSWFDADMCAAFGSILYRLSRRLNSVSLLNIPNKVEKSLSQNGFLSNYGRDKIPDTWGTTIPYQRFDIKDERYFIHYIQTELVKHQQLPKMSKELLRNFSQSIFEIFNNAVTHSETKMGIFSCGQFFPTRKRVVFSIADLGIGICQNVRDKVGLNLSAEEAIIWALKDKNTTKNGFIPGGLGLKLIQEFIRLNQGHIQIVSDQGYWELRDNGEVSTMRFSYPFPGTVVNIEINTEDTKSYILTSEDVSVSDRF